MTLYDGIIIFIVIDLIILISIFTRKKRLNANELYYINQNWQKILNILKNNPKQAILDADKLLNFILTKKGYQGTLGDKLKKANNLFNNINNIWYAHKIRNKIAHELDFQINQSSAKKIIDYFKQGFNDLDIKL